jgi:CBS domain-containing protein
MNIGQYCRQAVIGIDEGCTLRDAALLMREEHVGALVVTTAVADERDAVGVLTDRDIADAVALHGLSPTQVLVGAVASRPPQYVQAAASPADAAFAMRRAGVRRLLLVDDEEGVIGLVSSDDLLSIRLVPLMALSHLATVGRANESALATGDSRIRPLALRMRDSGLRRPESSPAPR